MKGTERKEREGREKDGKKGRVRKGEGKETGKNGVALCRLQNSCGGGGAHVDKCLSVTWNTINNMYTYSLV